jgi:hypothetical protein
MDKENSDSEFSLKNKFIFTFFYALVTSILFFFLISQVYEAIVQNSSGKIKAFHMSIAGILFMVLSLFAISSINNIEFKNSNDSPSFLFHFPLGLLIGGFALVSYYTFSHVTNLSFNHKLFVLSFIWIIVAFTPSYFCKLTPFCNLKT